MMFTKKLKQTKQELEKAEISALFINLKDKGLVSQSSSIMSKCAIDLFNEYEMELHYCMAGITAGIPKRRWDNHININVPSRQYQSFYNDLPDEEKENLRYIYGYGGESFRKAVFYAVINARIAGVI